MTMVTNPHHSLRATPNSSREDTLSPATSSDPTTKAAATGTSNGNEGRSSGESTETLINVDDEALLGPKGALYR